MDMFNTTKKAFESMHQTLAEKEMASISLSSVAQGVLDSMKIKYDTQKTIESMHQTLAEKAMASISLSSVAQSVIDSMKMSIDTQKAIDSLGRNEAFYRSIASLAQPAYRECAFGILNKSVLNNSSNLSYENVDFDINVLEDDIKKLSTAEDHNKFSDIFAKIPLQVQMILIFIFLQIFLPQINSISANLITPYINEYLLSSKATDREKIKDISKINLINPILEMDKLRFITRYNVILRSRPSTKTEILDELCLGQVVTVISKKRNWIEIQYINQDEEILRGWVFTRYTARFKK